ncbi:MAG: alpha-L-fucosidase 2 [Sediminicola sp.]|jgi:alpha-L-fucosidase 2
MHFSGDLKFTNASNSDFLNLRVNYPENTNGAGYEGIIRVVIDGGKKSISGNILTVTNAKTVTLLTRTEKYYSNCENQWNKKISKISSNKYLLIIIPCKKARKKHIRLFLTG